MACPKYDFHIHTKYLKCANETMELPAIVQACERAGCRAIGITDHLNTLDKLPLHLEIRRDIEALDPAIPVYFGVELNYTGCDEAFAFSREIKAEYGFQFAIGGIHDPYVDAYDLKKIVDIQHRHHLKTCADPLVDVLVHPYWFGRRKFDEKGWPWFDSVRVVPEAYARELGQAAKATGTAIEINAEANVCRQVYGEDYVKAYVDYLAVIAAEGPMFSVASDSHDISHLAAITESWRVADLLGLSEDRIWRPAGVPLRGAS